MSAPAFPEELIRPDLRDFTGYSSARTSYSSPGTSTAATAPVQAWLNANEAGLPNLADPGARVRRYPEPQPPALVAALADLYAVAPEELVVARGSDEAIDLLVRAICRPGQDSILQTSPTFGMYAVSARLHGVRVVDVPQRQVEGEFGVDVEEVAAAALEQGCRIIFLTSPGNPTGSLVPAPDVERLLQLVQGRAVVVVDEAYLEFAQVDSVRPLTEQHPTLVVLRTLSKAHALAAARIGVALAHRDLAVLLRRVQAPYPIAEPAAALAVRALEPEALADTEARVASTVANRSRLVGLLRASPAVQAVHEGRANFVIARSRDAAGLLDHLQECGIVVRDLSRYPGLHDAVRVSVGSSHEIDLLERALSTDDPRPSADTTTPDVRNR